MTFSRTGRRGYRWITLVQIACLAFLGLACSVPRQETASELSVPPEQITPADVEVYGVRLFRGDSSYEVEGQIQNNSPSFTLTEFQFQMAMQDCLPTGVCEILAEDVSTIAANVPPGQSTTFQVSPDFSDMPAPQGQLGWHYSIVATTGATP